MQDENQSGNWVERSRFGEDGEDEMRGEIKDVARL
jgi:hypothetical protein